MEELTPTTYQQDAGTIQAVVGDEKQPDFLPRLKLKKWNNEVNFSIGLADTAGSYAVNGNQINFTGTQDASFYPTSQTPSTIATQLRWINLGAINPVDVPIEYELSRHIPSNLITIATYYSNTPALMYFGNYNADIFTDNSQVDIPQVRAASNFGNPYFMDSGLLMLDVHYNHHDMGNLPQLLNEATKQILLETYGIETFNKGNKLYYQDPDGNDVKICSPQTDLGHTWTYLNIDTDYNHAYDYYKAGVDQITNDPYAYGLKRNYPQVDVNIATLIVQRFAQLAQLQLQSDTYTADEEAMREQLRPIHQDTNWVRLYERSDFNWWYDDRPDGFEFAITLTQKPDSNQIPLTLQSKSLKFHYQPRLTGWDAFTHYRPIYVEDSWTAYHADKEGNQYESGKAFHIYRLWAKDATGKQVWCSLQLNVDSDGNLLSNDATVVVPQDFLDGATFPVLIDPTFGYTTVGASTVAPGGTTIYGIPANPNNTGVLQKVTASILQADSGKASQVAVYTASNSTKLVGSNNFTTTVNPQTWTDYTLISNPTITAISYYLVFSQTSGQYEVVSYDTVTNGGVQASWTYVSSNDAMPSTLTFTTNNDKISIYGTYAASFPVMPTDIYPLRYRVPKRQQPQPPNRGGFLPISTTTQTITAVANIAGLNPTIMFWRADVPMRTR